MELRKPAEDITFSLRISSELNGKICAAAEKEKRSRQAQIVYTLEKLFETRETAAHGEKEKRK